MKYGAFSYYVLKELSLLLSKLWLIVWNTFIIIRYCMAIAATFTLSVGGLKSPLIWETFTLSVEKNCSRIRLHCINFYAWQEMATVLWNEFVCPALKKSERKKTYLSKDALFMGATYYPIVAFIYLYIIFFIVTVNAL